MLLLIIYFSWDLFNELFPIFFSIDKWKKPIDNLWINGKNLNVVTSLICNFIEF